MFRSRSRIVKLSRNHLDIIDALRSYGRFSPSTDHWTSRRVGNARSVRLLRQLGLVETQVRQGPRGGRIVERRLTDAGNVLALQFGEDLEMGRFATYTFRLEAR